MADIIPSNLTATSLIAPRFLFFLLSFNLFRHIFGISNNWRNHVHFINDHKLLYPAGHNVVVYNTDEKQQTYISGVEGYRGYSTLAVSPLRK